MLFDCGIYIQKPYSWKSNNLIISFKLSLTAIWSWIWIQLLTGSSFFQHGAHLSGVKSLVKQLPCMLKCAVVSMVSRQREGWFMKYNYPCPAEIILTAQTKRERSKQGLGLPCTGIIQGVICIFMRCEKTKGFVRLVQNTLRCINYAILPAFILFK